MRLQAALLVGRLIDENKAVQPKVETLAEGQPKDQPKDQLASAHALLDEIENQFKK